MRDTYGNMSIPSDRYQAHRRSLNFELMAVGTVLLFLLSLVSGCSLMLFVVLRLGLLGAVCCFVSAVSVRIGCFLPLPAALDLASLLPIRFVGPRLWAGSPSWSMPFGVSRCCLCCYTYAHLPAAPPRWCTFASDSSLAQHHVVVEHMQQNLQQVHSQSCPPV